MGRILFCKLAAPLRDIGGINLSISLYELFSLASFIWRPFKYIDCVLPEGEIRLLKTTDYTDLDAMFLPGFRVLILDRVLREGVVLQGQKGGTIFTDRSTLEDGTGTGIYSYLKERLAILKDFEAIVGMATLDSESSFLF